MKSAENKKKWVTDPEVAQVVKDTRGICQTRHYICADEVERVKLKAKIAELKEQIANISTMQQGKEQFIEAVRKFMEMDNLTAPLLRELIEHIDVHEVEGVGKNRTQRFVIHYRFVGYIELPESAFKSNFKENTRQGVAVEYVPKAIPA